MFWNISGGQPSGYIEKNQGACIPMFAPVDVQLDQDDKTMVQPDRDVRRTDSLRHPELPVSSYLPQKV